MALMSMIQVTDGSVCAALVCKDDVVVEAAPIFRRRFLFRPWSAVCDWIYQSRRRRYKIVETWEA